MKARVYIFKLASAQLALNNNAMLGPGGSVLHDTAASSSSSQASYSAKQIIAH